MSLTFFIVARYVGEGFAVLQWGKNVFPKSLHRLLKMAGILFYLVER